MTKAYTIARLIREVSALSNRQTSNINSLASALSPREGINSVKLAVLNGFLSYDLDSVVRGNGRYRNLGKTARTRVVRALRARANGTFSN